MNAPQYDSEKAAIEAWNRRAESDGADDKFEFISFDGCEFLNLPESWEKKPCPFCGNTEIIAFKYTGGYGERYGITCANCLATMNSGWWQDKLTALTAWNRRADTEQTEVMAMIEG